MYAELVRKCSHCGIVKPNEEFHLNGNRRKDGTCAPRVECKVCSTEVHRQYVEKKRDKINARRRECYKNDINGFKTKISNYNVKKLYGLSPDKYKEMHDEQGGCCKICGSKSSDAIRRLDVDHDHATGKIRGLLCISCNRGIGLLKDNPEFLRKAAYYLEKNKN